MTRIVRPLPNSAISNFANWVQKESWELVFKGSDPSDMVDRFNLLLDFNLKTHCPTKTVKISNLDGKICSAAVKQAARRKNREYTKHGNSTRYKELKKVESQKLKEATVEFLDKQVNQVATNSNSWLKHIKLLAARPGDQLETSFKLPKHLEDNLSNPESFNAICQYFSKIGQEYINP